MLCRMICVVQIQPRKRVPYTMQIIRLRPGKHELQITQILQIYICVRHDLDRLMGIMNSARFMLRLSVRNLGFMELIEYLPLHIVKIT